ncbi:diaminopimelate decarboxylase [Fictibacillus phosphorivorans]|uniref:diaminopimelate decarboxylase n=1 Tax=Fictibacillus phosphorivorans TaxID=1221500 RepID=UPI00203D6D18|nr:diaminopimelate decarboxylase [Fictibacillus phosphorivorans]MCM3777389.1 diaminopimelate decarboxylase [Fictibacillus phosphorivorans]
MNLHGTAKIGKNNHLWIGGTDTVELAKKYGTPLYLYDVELIRTRARGFKKAFEEKGVGYQVAYASKAFSSIAIIQLMDQEGLSLDVVSGGELYTALQAEFPAERIHFHGNNKCPEELEFALTAGVGCIVVDNFYEINLLKTLCRKLNKTVKVLLRLTPGIEAHTHDYIITGQEDSKFGFDLGSGQADKALDEVLGSEYFEVLGIHCHIGSQIFETEGFTLAIDKLFSHFKIWEERFNYFPSVVNLGGGFGIQYTSEDTPLEPEQYVLAMIDEVQRKMADFDGKSMPELWIEPGRSLVGDAGTTIYSIGSQKEIEGVRHYVSVDGGMTDNIRPALYQAKYDAYVANNMNEKPSQTVSIAGKCCESGDMLIWDLELPEVTDQDYLAVSCTGAYGYSMANNYNRIQRPAVVFAENGEDQLVVKRETYADLIRQDMPLKSKVFV